MPDNFTGPTQTLVMYHDGVGETEQSVITDGQKRPVIQALLDAGAMVVSTNSHGNSWGNDDSLVDYTALYDFVTDHFRIDETAFLSQSMGGVSGLLTFAAGTIPNVKAWAGIYPVCNLAESYSHVVPSFSGQIDTAYDIPGGGSYAAQTSGHDPALLASSTWNSKYLRFYASAADTSVPKADHTDVIAANASGATEASVAVCTGNHGDSSHFQPSDLISFYQRAGLSV